ncbi:hypothetical protein [Streptomyces sp. H27-D2]|uniref:hypothetical protein n=1 Tax=Streptomyces sp. H27-D2 TaxID=3046304 RepID=UPI002DBBFF73|nr:hypothetical protein [Streptomyces sp. H27-D2]MEC4020919.1 hypothetical protein [Streptomyces sp. H27-D2]
MRAHGTRTTRGVAAAAAVLALGALGLTAGCGGSSSDDADAADTPKKESAARSPADSVGPAPEKGASGGENGRTLSKSDLDKAVLSGTDVPGFTVNAMEGAPSEGEKADKAACRPLTAVINGLPEPKGSATVYRQLLGKGAGGETVVTEFLAAHRPQQAGEVLDGLRAAAKACAGGFTARGGDSPSKYSAVKELTAPKAGDDAFAYQVTGVLDGDAVPLLFQVVRSGSTVATFYTANLTDDKTPEIPAAVAKAQAEKLTG